MTIHIGNAENFETSNRGWFVGAFLDERHGPLKTDDVELNPLTESRRDRRKLMERIDKERARKGMSPLDGTR